jgi:hypothetical protein
MVPALTGAYCGHTHFHPRGILAICAQRGREKCLSKIYSVILSSVKSAISNLFFSTFLL